MNFIYSRAEFEAELEKIGEECSNKILFYSQKIAFCRGILEAYRRELRTIEFGDSASEILFFKEQKQIPQVSLVYFLALRNYEVEIHGVGQPLKFSFLTKKVEEVSSFLSSQIDFIKYLELEQSYLDEIYFTRKFAGLDHSFRSYSLDPEFCTSHDLLLSEIIAQKKFLQFLQSQLKDLNDPGSEISNSPKLLWTAQKVDLTELIYALHHSGAINNGNASLRLIAESMQKSLGIDLGDYHHTFLRMRDRTQPVKFLDKLRENLNERMQNLDS